MACGAGRNGGACAWRPPAPLTPPSPPHRSSPLPRRRRLPQIRAKRRGKANLPYAWGVLGEGGDFDQVAHVATISKADYLAGLEEELQ